MKIDELKSIYTKVLEGKNFTYQLPKDRYDLGTGNFDSSEHKTLQDKGILRFLFVLDERQEKKIPLRDKFIILSKLYDVTIKWEEKEIFYDMSFDF